MKSICLIIYDFTKKGGAERASAKLANELVKHYKVTIISVFNELHSDAYEINDNIEIERIIKGKGSILKNLICIERAIRKVIKNNCIDIIISVDIATALISVLAAKASCKRLIICDRSSCYNQNMYDKLSMRIYAWVGVHFCDRLQVMTEDGRNGWLEKYRIKKDKILVIPNWIDKDAITNTKYDFSNKRIITVGRATPEKNYEELIRIASKIAPNCGEWKWHIWGDFSSAYGRKLQKEITDKKLNDFLVLKGISSSIYSEYPKYSFFVLTSQFEGMPNVLLEAQGSKLPTIAYDCKTGPSELIKNGVNGFLIKLNNTEEMVANIKELMTNEMLAIKFSAHSDINYDKYSKETVLNLWIKLIEGELK